MAQTLGFFYQINMYNFFMTTVLNLKVSLNTRRTSPPLNIAQSSQSSRNLEFYVST